MLRLGDQDFLRRKEVALETEERAEAWCDKRLAEVQAWLAQSFYSCRRVEIGSTRVARTAGM